MNFKRSSSIKFYFFFFSCATALAVSILTTNQWEQNFTGRQALLPPNFTKIKLYIWALPLIKLLKYWQQCITSFSTIPFKRTLLAISKISSQHPGVRWTKIVLPRVLSLLRHHSKKGFGLKKNSARHLSDDNTEFEASHKALNNWSTSNQLYRAGHLHSQVHNYLTFWVCK